MPPVANATRIGAHGNHQCRGRMLTQPGMGAVKRDARPTKAHRLAWMLVACSTASLWSSPVSADEDPWFGPDKAKHFGASATIAAAGYGVGIAVFDDRTSALALGGGLALTAGIGKEVYDATGAGDPSERDLVWDVAGTATGLGVAWLLDLLIRGSGGSATRTSKTSASLTGEGYVVRFRF